MDALIFRASVLLAATLSLGAGSSPGQVLANPANSCRSQHFIVTAPTQQFAREVCQAAERYRRDLAIEWLGRELPPWRDACRMHVTVGRIGAGGATSFEFIGNEPCRWRMNIQGTRERILDSVLPHEITHMILATHMGRPLPRWADEGAATSVEHVSERSKQQKFLIHFLRNDRGIPFSVMYALKDYPNDILPLYSQGYSVARYLIAQGGKRKFVDYVADGMKWNNWTAATKKHYGYASLLDLQTAWNDWVKHGSRLEQIPTRLASQTRTTPIVPIKHQTPANFVSASELVPLPPRTRPAPRVATGPVAQPETAARPVSSLQNGWYSRQRDLALERSTSGSASPPTKSSSQGTQQHLGRPQPPQGPGQVILQWSRDDRAPAGGTIMR